MGFKPKQRGSVANSELTPPPQLSLGHSAGGNSDGFRDAVLLWVHRISVLRHITSEMARLHLGHAGVLGIYTVVGGGPFSSS